MAAVVLDINLDKKCVECRKSGATQSGVCLHCVTKALEGKPMKSAAARTLQLRIMKLRAAK